jgi:hypothetical protein
MRYISEFFGNYAVLCSILGWTIAQVLKCITTFIKEKKINFKRLLFASGGMPSSHSATVCALCASIAKSEGLGTPAFAISGVFAFIVMYDATGVRRAAGEQAKILNHLVNNLTEHKPIYVQKKLKELIGHTPLEVVVGALLGILIVLLMPYRY